MREEERLRLSGTPITARPTSYSKTNIVVHRVARHVMGHIFGLGHPPCPSDPGGVASVMGCARDGKYDLHTHDRDDMNVKY